MSTCNSQLPSGSMPSRRYALARASPPSSVCRLQTIDCPGCLSCSKNGEIGSPGPGCGSITSDTSCSSRACSTPRKAWGSMGVGGDDGAGTVAARAGEAARWRSGQLAAPGRCAQERRTAVAAVAARRVPARGTARTGSGHQRPREAPRLAGRAACTGRSRAAPHSGSAQSAVQRMADRAGRQRQQVGHMDPVRHGRPHGRDAPHRGSTERRRMHGAAPADSGGEGGMEERVFEHGAGESRGAKASKRAWPTIQGSVDSRLVRSPSNTVRHALPALLIPSGDAPRARP